MGNDDDNSNNNNNNNNSDMDDVCFVKQEMAMKKRVAPEIFVLEDEDVLSWNNDAIQEPVKKKCRYTGGSQVIDLTLDQYDGDYSRDMPYVLDQKPSVISLLDDSSDDDDNDEEVGGDDRILLLFDENPQQQQNQLLDPRKPAPAAAASIQRTVARRHTFPLASSVGWCPPGEDSTGSNQGGIVYFRLGDDARTRKPRRRQERRATMPLIMQQQQQQQYHQDPVVGFMETVETQWSHERKREHFQTARRSQFLLRQELFHLHTQLAMIVQQQQQQQHCCTQDGSTDQTVEYKLCQDQIQLVQRELTIAQDNAAKDIYHRNNSAGTMGMDEAGKLYIDFHGLYVKEAIERFHETVLPVLPVQNVVQIIVGRGKHSKPNPGRAAPLKFGLMRYLQNKRSIVQGDHRLDHIHCHVDPMNHGVLIVRWQDTTTTPTS